ncbi:MAG: hypothetical protein HRU03_03130 [Nanoarchaeales archaeon]|nr:hypothetical protein [Nanoarchaeales archaeon]
MPKENIRKYILEYKRDYTKSQIVQALTGAGYKLSDINQVYYSLPSKKILKRNFQSQNLIILKIIIFIIIITYIMIYGISYLSNL